MTETGNGIRQKNFLFTYFLTREIFPKEEIMRESLGTSDEKSADRDFKVALNALLKVLEPHRSARENSFFILRKQSMYRLNPDADIRSDLDNFHKYTDNGIVGTSPLQSLLNNLLKAASLYKGRYLKRS